MNWVENQETKRRWKRFYSRPGVIVACAIFAVLLLLSVTAEFVANSQPIVMSYESSLYFPVLKVYHPSVFDQEGYVTNYRDW